MAADFPAKIYCRPPVIPNRTPHVAALYSDLYQEIVAIETYAGYGAFASSVPSANFATLAARLDGLLSDGGRFRRKVASFFSKTGTYDGVIGAITNTITCGITGTITPAGSKVTSTITFPVTYVGGQLPYVFITPASNVAGTDATQWEPLLTYCIAGSITTTQFQAYTGMASGNTFIAPTKAFKLHWIAVGGTPA